MDRAQEILALFKNGSLQNFALSLCRNVDDADDLAMDVVTKLLEKKHLIPREIPIEAYAIKAVRNRFVDKVRFKRKFSDIQSPAIDDDFFDNLRDDLAESKITSPLVLKQILNSLDDRCQELLMAYATGDTYRELADGKGVHIGTIKSQMSRCREALIQELQG